ncbi:uncharacterized protein EKO05_0003164 [Ascochyta rabiei]|nr:uncharacterized protein EKO05_0003164 [Ascochyta rabiei]UPX12623.1 hypothetical protein EKO05_0003164 [Ascochyta rabiei]
MIHAKTEDTGGIDKHRAKSTDKTRHAAGAASKSKPATKPERDHGSDEENGEDDPGRDTARATGEKKITIFTISTEPHVKKPIICHRYTPPTPPTASNQPPFIFTHGAGGTLSAPAVVNFCTGFASASLFSILVFQGSVNLGARAKGFHACRAHVCGPGGGAHQPLLLGGRSMGARAAVMAATEDLAAVREGQRDRRVGLVLVSYPLQGPKEVRDRMLLDLPKGVEVLFVVGERDAMCPLELLEGVREKMKATSRVVVVRGADHGMNVRPAGGTREVGEETGKIAARWLSGEMEPEGETLYVGGEEK